MLHVFYLHPLMLFDAPEGVHASNAEYEQVLE